MVRGKRGLGGAKTAFFSGSLRFLHSFAIVLCNGLKKVSVSTDVDCQTCRGRTYITYVMARINRPFFGTMAKTKEQKKEILSRLGEAFDAPASVFVHFNGLSVGDETSMRKALRESGVSYFVARKTLMKRALDETKLSGDAPALGGEIAVAYAKDTEDMTAPARGVHAFVKQLGDKLAIVGGVFEGRFMDAAEMNEVATIPPVEVLRGMFANVINSPIQGLVIALNAVAEKKEA